MSDSDIFEGKEITLSEWMKENPDYEVINLDTEDFQPIRKRKNDKFYLFSHLQELFPEKSTSELQSLASSIQNKEKVKWWNYYIFITKKKIEAPISLDVYENCIFIGDFNFSKRKKIHLRNCSIIGSISINCEEEVNSISIINCFKTYKYKEALPNLNFKANKLDRIINIDSSQATSLESLKIRDVNLDVSFIGNDITPSIVNRIEISGKNKAISLEKIKCQKYTIKDATITSLILKDFYQEKISNEDEKQINETQTEYLYGNIPIKAKKTELKSTHIKKLSLSGSLPEETFTIEQCTIYQELALAHINFSTLKFSSCNIADATLLIQNAEIEKTTFENTLLPIKIKATSNDLRVNRSVYRHFKKVSEDHTDRIGMLQYYSMEMDTWLQEKKDLFKSVSTFLKGLGELPEIITVGTHKLLSNYGQSWTRPLIILLITMLPMTYCMIHEYSLTKLSTESFSTFFTEEYWRYYWSFINPTHKTEIAIHFDGNGKADKFRNVLGFGDTLIRIWSGFLIFYTLKGLRKYTNI